MAFLDFLPWWSQLLLFPVIALGLWMFLFNSKSSRFTKFVIEGGYLVFAIPLLVLTFLAVPLMLVGFYARTSGYNREFGIIFLVSLIGFSLIFEYYYIRRIIRQIEEREQMSIWNVFRREINPEIRRLRAKNKIETKEEAVSFFDEISVMNKERRELDQEQKEKVRRALLGEIDNEPSKQNQ